MRGRGEGKRAAWEGKGRRSGRPAGAQRERAERRGRGGGEEDLRGREGPRRALFFSLSSFLSPHLAFPLLSAPQDAASQVPGWRGRGSNCKTFRKLHRVAGSGLRGPTGRGRRRAPLTQAARPSRWRPLHPASFCQRLQPLSIRYLSAQDPSPGLMGKGRSPALGHRGKDWGRGSRAPCCALSANTCKSYFSIGVTPCVSVSGARGCECFCWLGLYPETQGKSVHWTSQKTDIITLTSNRFAGGSQRTKWKSHKREVKPQLFRITQQVTAAQSTGLRIRMLESSSTSTSDSRSDLGKVTWAV